MADAWICLTKLASEWPSLKQGIPSSCQTQGISVFSRRYSFDFGGLAAQKFALTARHLNEHHPVTHAADFLWLVSPDRFARIGVLGLPAEPASPGPIASCKPIGCGWQADGSFSR